MAERDDRLRGGEERGAYGPERDYGPGGLGSPGYGQWDYSEGNVDWGYASNYGQDVSNAYLDPEVNRGAHSEYSADYERYRRYVRRREYDRPSSPWGEPDWAESGHAGTGHREPGQPYGPMTGRGPRSYQRSDARILDDVNDRLTWRGQIDATEILVQVLAGEVSLSGTVDSRGSKRLAEDIAASVPGVHDVNNRLRVERPRAGRD